MPVCRITHIMRHRLDYGISHRTYIEVNMRFSAAFINPTKWATRVGMNIIPQGMIPWYYNTIVPLGEGAAKKAAFYAWSKWYNVVARS